MSPEHKEYISKRKQEGICPLCSKKLKNSYDINVMVCPIPFSDNRVHYLIDKDAEFYQLGDIYQEYNFTWVCVDFKKLQTKVRIPDQDKLVFSSDRMFLVDERAKLESFLAYI